jgi:hypothetical protein
VNKLNTKAEVRFHVSSADWLDSEVRGRLLEYQSNKVNKDGELVITSQEHRYDGMRLMSITWLLLLLLLLSCCRWICVLNSNYPINLQNTRAE